MLWRCLMVCPVLLAGCASSPVVDGLVDSARDACIVLPATLSYTVKRSGLMQDGEWDEGLNASVYKAEKENALGVFYRAPGRAVFRDFRKHGRFALQGGIWIPKTAAARPRIYFYGEPKESAFEGVNQQARAAEESAIARGASPVQAGVGAGIGAGIVSAIIASDWGKIGLLEEIEDQTFLARLPQVTPCPG